MDNSADVVVEGWVLAIAFDSLDAAGPAYERARDVIFAHDADASVYRVMLNGLTQVICLGFTPLTTEVRHELSDIMASGKCSTVPKEVLIELCLRHAEIRIHGINLKYERRGSQPPHVRFE